MGGRCVRRPGGRRFAPGEEVGSGCDREVLRQQTDTDWGAVGWRRELRKTQKRLRQVGRAGVELVLSIATEPRSGAVTGRGWNTNHLIIWTHCTDWWPVADTHTHTHKPEYLLAWDLALNSVVHRVDHKSRCCKGALRGLIFVHVFFH